MPSKKLLLTGGIAAGILILGGGGAGAYFVFLAPHHASASTAPAPPPPKPLLFAALPDIVVSVPDTPGDPASIFVQFGIQFATTDPAALTSFDTLTPIIKSKIIDLLMGQTAKSLSDTTARHALADACLAISNSVLAAGAHAPPPFQAAYITNLVVQD